MARKKIEPIVSLGSDINKLTVQKSIPLFALWQSELTLAEFKILDTYLARIDSHKPEKRAVIFEKGELEKLLGVKKINLSELKERLKHLMGNVVEVPDSSEKKGFKLITLFEEAIAELDDDGLWQIKLECTQKAMKYFFNVENLGYLRYKLRCITSITSRYTYIMFIYLEANRYRKTWEVPLEELKLILNCDKEETYKQFKRFNDLILKKVQKEMYEKTECKYSYESIKKGRSVSSIRFTVETLPEIEVEIEDMEQMTIEDFENVNRNLWHDAVFEFNFTKEELNEIFEVLAVIPSSKMPSDPDLHNNIEVIRYHYMKIKVAELKRRKVNHPFAYLIKMLKQDAGLSDIIEAQVTESKEAAKESNKKTTATKSNRGYRKVEEVPVYKQTEEEMKRLEKWKNMTPEEIDAETQKLIARATGGKKQ